MNGLDMFGGVARAIVCAIWKTARCAETTAPESTRQRAFEFQKLQKPRASNMPVPRPKTTRKKAMKKKKKTAASGRPVRGYFQDPLAPELQRVYG